MNMTSKVPCFDYQQRNKCENSIRAHCKVCVTGLMLYIQDQVFVCPYADKVFAEALNKATYPQYFMQCSQSSLEKWCAKR